MNDIPGSAVQDNTDRLAIVLSEGDIHEMMHLNLIRNAFASLCCFLVINIHLNSISY